MLLEPVYVFKGWGFEEILVNIEKKYCGKILHFEEGKKCSFHKHLLKEETFQLAEGQLIVRHGYDEDISKADTTVLNKGDIFHVPIGLLHQMEAVVPSRLYEFSTTDYPSDSYRIIKGD